MVGRMITSVSNKHMKEISQLNRKAKTRYERRVFVAEGMKMCMEAPKKDIVAMYVSESFIAKEGNRELLAGYSYETVSNRAFAAISDTKTPQGILCLVKMPKYRMEDLMKGRTKEGAKAKQALILVLENIQDPGNLGTMIRTGEGAGVTGLLMSQDSVDIFHPKVIRATMGSLYRVPFYVTPDLPGAIQRLKSWGVMAYAAHLEGSVEYSQPDYRRPTAFLVGNEGNGLSPQAARLADCQVKIPLEGNVESLNAAVAAALLMYEARRQR